MIKTIPAILNKNPNLNISQIFTPPLLKTIALGGVEIGNINENPTQIVAISITKLRIGTSKKSLVEAKIAESKIAIKAVELINIVKHKTSKQTHNKKIRIGNVPKYSKIGLKASPKCILAIAIAIQNPAPNKNITSIGIALESSQRKQPILGTNINNPKVSNKIFSLRPIPL